MEKVSVDSENKNLTIGSMFLYVLVSIALLSSFLGPRSAQCTTYYVDNLNGIDTNSGFIGQPWATLEKATKAAKAGDTVIVVSNGADKPYREIISLQSSGLPDNYIVFMGESSTNMPRIVGNGNETIFNCYEKGYLKIKNLSFENTSESGMSFFNCHHIEISSVEVRNAGKNGIVVGGGGSNYIIDGCSISEVHNSGIVLLGYEGRQLSNTLIQNCIVSDVQRNDGITLHKNSGGFDIGSNHVIRGNFLTKCGEQGIDITSGKNIFVENNITSENGDSGIVVGHNVENVSIKSHVSSNEKKYGIIIAASKNVLLMNSLIINPSSKAAMGIYNCDGLTVINSLIEHGPCRTEGSLVDIEPNVKNLKFEGNTFSVPERFSGVILRYILAGDPVSTGTIWSGNQWAIPVMAKAMYSDKDGDVSFDKFKEKYAPTDSLSNTRQGKPCVVTPPQSLRRYGN